jgi:hypothetical protein
MSGAADTAGGGTAPVPGDEQALAREIEQTRAELGETVAALAAKADVKARAAAKVHALTGRLTSKASGIGERASGRAGQAREKLAGQAERGRTLLAASSRAGQHAQRQGASAVAAPVRQAGQRAVTAARRHPVPAALAAAALVLAIVAAARGRRS